MKKVFTHKVLLFLLGVLFALSSCIKVKLSDPAPATGNGTDTPNPVTPGTNNQPLITRYEYAPNLYTLFKYNTNGQVTDITDINDNAREDRTVSYKPDGKVDKISDKNGFVKLTYNNNQVVQADSYLNGSTAVQTYYKFVYDGQKVVQLILYNNFGSNGTQPISKIDMQYNANGDIIRSDTYEWKLTTGIYNKVQYALYENDTHPNPLYAIKDIVMVLYRAVGPHNNTRVRGFYPDGSLDLYHAYKFQYNNNGQPTSAVVSGEDDVNSIVIKFLYN